LRPGQPARRQRRHDGAPQRREEAGIAQVREERVPDRSDGGTLAAVAEVRGTRGVRHHELAEARHEGSHEQARARRGDPQRDEGVPGTAGEQRGTRPGEQRQHEQRPAPAGEIDHQAGRVELELARIEPDHRHAQTRRDALGEVRGGSHQRVEEQAVAHREPELEGPLALDEGLVALTERVGEHPPERGGVRQRGDRWNDERPYHQRVRDRPARDAIDDALGECVADVRVVERGRRAGAELAAVDECGLRVPGDGGSGERQGGGHHEGDGGATPPAVRHGQIVTVELDGRRLAGPLCGDELELEPPGATVFDALDPGLAQQRLVLVEARREAAQVCRQPWPGLDPECAEQSLVLDPTRRAIAAAGVRSAALDRHASGSVARP
jgi:hypothetical protein